MEWFVWLEGNAWSLEYLPRWFSKLDHKVRSEGKYYLVPSASRHCATSAEVWDLAEQIVERINAATKAFVPQFRPARVGAETTSPPIPATSSWSREPCKPSTTRSTPGCHPGLRYKTLPMSPGRTEDILAEGSLLAANILCAPGDR
jgi:hypothetical protein